jgi:glycerol-3-phosphate acyltransferase PlsY
MEPMDAVLAIAVVVVSYFLGTFPSALIVAKRGGIDVTKEGSGNPGTSNVVRLLGWKYGAVVFLADVLKGSASVALAWWVTGDRVTMLGFGCAYAAVIGHTYPITRGFKGGKGVATGGGSMYVLYPLMSLVLCISWFVLRKSTGKSSVASLVITIAVPIYVGFFREDRWELAATLGLVAVVILRHLPNIRRLRSNDELGA